MASIRRRWSKHVFGLVFLICHIGRCIAQSAQVVRIAPTSGHSLGGYVVTVSGSEFRIGIDSYVCRFSCGPTAFEDVAASPPQDPDKLECTVPQWRYSRCSSTLYVLDSGSIVPSEQPEFKFDAAWSAMSLNEIFFGGGASLELLGAGFDSGQAYKCVFTDANTGVPWGGDITATYSSPSKIVCNPPAYEAGGTVEVSVYEGETQLEKVPPSNNILTITASGWSQASPKIARVAANFTFTILGQGFQTGGTDAYYATFRSGVNQVSAPCAYVSATSLSCNVPAWQFGEVAAAVTLFQGSGIVGRSSGGTFLLRFIASWDSVTGTLKGPVAGGQNLTIRGTGFVATYGGYSCIFEEIGAPASTRATASSRAVVVSRTMLICTTPEWPSEEQNVTMALSSVFHNALAPYMGTSRANIYEYVTSWTRLSGAFTEDLLRPAASAAATGSTKITVIGAGFSRAAGSGYACVVTCYDSSACGSNSFRVAAESTEFRTMITCTMPAWLRFDNIESVYSPATVRVLRASGIELQRTSPTDTPILFTRASFYSGGALYNGNAGGGLLITLNGAGFCHADSSCNKNAYACQFQKIGNSSEFALSKQCVKGAKEGSWCSTDQECPDGLCIAEFTSISVTSKILSNTQIVCASPRWPFSIGDTVVVLLDATYGGLGGSVPVGSTGDVTKFRYTTEVRH
jgi:hypothetical protein